MRKLVFISLFLSAVIFAQSQDRVYYYYDTVKIYLDRDNSVKFVKFANETTASTSPSQRGEHLNTLRSQNIQIDTLGYSMYVISGDFNQTAARNALATMQQDSNILYISDMLLSNGRPVWESNEIIVKIFPDEEIAEVLKANNMPYKKYRRLGSNPQTYLVTLDVSKRSGLEYANSLVESESVEAA